MVPGLDSKATSRSVPGLLGPGLGSRTMHTFTPAHSTGQSKFQGQAQVQGNRLHLLIRGATKPYPKGLDSKRGTAGAILATNLLHT